MNGTPSDPVPEALPVTEPRELTLLRSMVAADIKRNGKCASFMVRNGLLSDILDRLSSTRPPPSGDRVREALEREREGWEQFSRGAHNEARINMNRLRAETDTALSTPAAPVVPEGLEPDALTASIMARLGPLLMSDVMETANWSSRIRSTIWLAILEANRKAGNPRALLTPNTTGPDNQGDDNER